MGEIGHSIYRIFRCLDRAVVSKDRVFQSIDDDDNSLDEVGQCVEEPGVSIYRDFNFMDRADKYGVEVFKFMLDDARTAVVCQGQPSRASPESGGVARVRPTEAARQRGPTDGEMVMASRRWTASASRPALPVPQSPAGFAAWPGCPHRMAAWPGSS